MSVTVEMETRQRLIWLPQVVAVAMIRLHLPAAWVAAAINASLRLACIKCREKGGRRWSKVSLRSMAVAKAKDRRTVVLETA